MHWGIIGGIAGAILGIIGGIIGTYFSIKNTNSKQEKAFVTKASIITWIGIIIFLLLLIFIPRPYNFLMFIPYGILLPLAIRKWNKEQQKIIEGERK